MPPRFFAPDASTGATTTTLSRDESHHLTHVLRLAPGAEVRVFNGRGDEWAGRVALASARAVTIDLLQATTPAPEPPAMITLAVGLLKGDQMDTVVRDATMMGVRAIVPMTTAHVVVPPRAWESGRAVERWRRVAVASAKQCGRAVVPDISSVRSFSSVVADPWDGPMLIAVEPAAGAEIATFPKEVPASACALIGPEGGWAAEEVERAISAGASPITLGPRTLRAETAPIVLLSALWARWGW